MNRIDVKLENICRFEDGALKSVDFSRIYSLSREGRPGTSSGADLRGPSVCLMTRPQLAGLSGLFGPLFARPAGTSLLPVRASEMRLARTSRPPQAAELSPLLSPLRFEKRNSNANIRLQPLPKKTYSVEKTARSPLGGSGGAQGRIEMEIPFGMPRFVNARTLKAMLGAHRRDVLLRKVRERWEICPDSLQVDLEDRSQVFRLGEVQIFS